MSNRDMDLLGFIFKSFSFVFAIVETISKWFAKNIFSPLKFVCIEFLALEEKSWYWSRNQALNITLRCVRIYFSLYYFLPTVLAFILIFLAIFSQAVRDKFFVNPSIEQVINLLIFIIGGLMAGLFIAIVSWFEEFGCDAEIQSKLAGNRAETSVGKEIELYCDSRKGFKVLQNQLFVFNRTMENEFSVEIDHILITDKNIFLVETKYKSGQIYVDEHAESWRVTTQHGESKMRNALKQVKNSVRVFNTQFNFPFQIIPVVVIVGEYGELINAPRNVIPLEKLKNLLNSFDLIQVETKLDAEQIYKMLSVYISNTETDMKRHIERAQVARRKKEVQSIVRSSSL